MTRYSPYTWADNEAGATPITAARLNALEAGADADVPVADITATGTADSTTYLRGDGTWATPPGGTPSDASTTVKGIVELATSAETTTGTDTVRATTPAGVKAVADTLAPLSHTHAASDVTSGTVATARLGSGTASSSTYLRGDQTWATLPAATSASDTVAGVVELATTTEATTGTDTVRAVTPAGVKAVIDAHVAATASYRDATFSQGGTLTTGTGQFKLYNRSGYTRTIRSVTASVGTQPTGASVLVDVNKNGTTIFTTQSNRPTIAVSTSEDVSGAPDVTSWADGDYITIDIDQIGSTVAGSNLVVTVIWS